MGTSVGGIDLINYSELYHPMSHHHVSLGHNKVNVLPTDLDRARADAEMVQKGYYNKEAL